MTAKVKTAAADDTPASPEPPPKKLAELETRLLAWQSFGVDLISTLDAIVHQKVSVMASDQRLVEIQTQNQRTLLLLINRANDLLKRE